jgi:outer membrane protein TolC
MARSLPVLIAAMGLFSSRAPAETVDSWVREALGSNLALQANDLRVEAGLRAVAEARATLRPKVSVVASYTRTDGGRTIDVPLGDLLRPLYDTLNQLTAANGTSLRPIDNLSFSLTEKREQNTMLQIEAPVYDPALTAAVRGNKADFDALRADREVLARTLVRDVRQACYDVLRTQADLRNAISAQESYQENLRATRILNEQGQATLEPVLRAQTELLAAEQSIMERRDGVRQAQRYLNFLVNRALDSPALVERDPQELETQLREAQPRAELRRAEAQIRAASAHVAVARAEGGPTLNLKGAYGVTGEKYSFSGDDDSATIGLYLSWNVLDFGAQRARLSQARLTQRRLEIERTHLEAQVALEARQAADAVQVSASALHSAEARRSTAAEALRIAEGRREVGSLTQLQFFDARRALSDAEAAETASRYRHLANLADLELVLAAYLLPPL